MQSLSIQREHEGGTPVLRLAGELDRLTVDAVDDAVREMAGEADDALVIDLAGLEFIDSAGLRTLSRAHNVLVDCGRRLVVRGPSAAILRLIDLVGLRDILTIEAS